MSLIDPRTELFKVFPAKKKLSHLADEYQFVSDLSEFFVPFVVHAVQRPRFKRTTPFFSVFEMTRHERIPATWSVGDEDKGGFTGFVRSIL